MKASVKFFYTYISRLIADYYSGDAVSIQVVVECELRAAWHWESQDASGILPNSARLFALCSIRKTTNQLLTLMVLACFLVILVPSCGSCMHARCFLTGPPFPQRKQNWRSSSSERRFEGGLPLLVESFCVKEVAALARL